MKGKRRRAAKGLDVKGKEGSEDGEKGMEMKESGCEETGWDGRKSERKRRKGLRKGW